MEALYDWFSQYYRQLICDALAEEALLKRQHWEGSITQPLLGPPLFRSTSSAKELEGRGRRRP